MNIINPRPRLIGASYGIVLRCSAVARSGNKVLILCSNEKSKKKLVKLADEINGKAWPIGLKIMTADELSKKNMKDKKSDMIIITGDSVDEK